MKQRKIAISLAVVAAIATPLASGAYWAEPTSKTLLVPFSKEREAEVRSLLADTNNCQNLDRLQQKIDEAQRTRDKNDPFSGYMPPDAFTACTRDLKAWQDGGYLGYDFSLSKYLALNAAAAAIAFIAIFGLSYLLPALARRYWRWLNT
jgi:hypothetical protein